MKTRRRLIRQKRKKKTSGLRARKPCTRNRRLCRSVAPTPRTPLEDGAAPRNPGDDGFNMLVVLTALSRGRGACELSRASQSGPGPTHGRRQKRSSVMGRLRPPLLRHSITHDRCERFAERTSMAAHSSSYVRVLPQGEQHADMLMSRLASMLLCDLLRPVLALEAGTRFPARCFWIARVMPGVSDRRYAPCGPSELRGQILRTGIHVT